MEQFMLKKQYSGSKMYHFSGVFIKTIIFYYTSSLVYILKNYLVRKIVPRIWASYCVFRVFLYVEVYHFIDIFYRLLLQELKEVMRKEKKTNICFDKKDISLLQK